MKAPRTSTGLAVTGVVLAGGQGARCGGADKGFLRLHGQPLIEHALRHLAPQVHSLLISANRHHERYARYRHPVLTDEHARFAGPMAGVLTALQHTRTEWLQCVPVDAARLPSNLVQRLHAAAMQAGARAAVAHDGMSIIPVACLIHRDLAHDLRNAFDNGQRSLRDWLRRHAAVECRFDEHPRRYWSVNTLDELATLNQDATLRDPA